MGGSDPVAAWRYTDGSNKPPFFTRKLWEFAAFLVAHIFLWPLFFVAALYLLAKQGPIGMTLAIVIAVLYALTYLDKSQHTGKRYSFSFLRGWPKCHHIWSLKTVMSTGKGWSHMPVEEHSKVFNVNEKPFIFAAFPHGAIPMGASVLGPQLTRWPQISQRVRFGVHSALFWFPLLRDFYLAFGSVLASRSTLLHQLRDLRNSIVILPGGVEEQLLLCPPGVEQIVLSKRKGFVKLALETGSNLVPVYFFGERQAYKLNDGPALAVSRLLKKLFGLGIPLPHGRYHTLQPYAVPITIVIGKPIVVVKAVPSPEEEAVDALHAEFVKQLHALYDEHKEAAGYGHVKLEIL